MRLPTDLSTPSLAKIREFLRRRRFRRRSRSRRFLFEYLYRRGVRHSFGLPGDFALPTFSWLEIENPKCPVTHEPAAGSAADANARINGIGLVCVTYCVGGPNVLNAIAVWS